MKKRIKNKSNLICTILFVIFYFISSNTMAQIGTPEGQLELFDGQGIPTMEALDKGTYDPSLLRKLRSEIQALQIKEQNETKDLSTIQSVNKRFVPESATFAIAGGAIYFHNLMLVTNSDPALMVKHIESLRDPIAHLAFYSFMAANGIYINFKTKDMNPIEKHFAMRTLQYKGMALGSLASTFTADILGTLKECTTGWIRNKADENAYAACDEALKTWTLRNKSTQVGPQILSLVVSQYASDATTDLGRMAKGKISGNTFYKAEASALKFFNISGAQIQLAFSGGSFTVKALSWLGKLKTFSMFLAVDHLLTPSVMKIGNNLIQPFYFQFDIARIDRLFKNASDFNWDAVAAQKNNSNFKAECPVQIPNCKNFETLPKEIENLTYRMQQWRMHLNSKVDTKLDGWISEANKLLHQIEFSKNYYRTFLNHLYSSLKRSHQVKNGEFSDEPHRAWSTETIYPYRTLPLYGVNPNVDYKGESAKDLYLIKPWLIQQHQSLYLIKVGTTILENFEKNSSKLNSSYSDQKFKNLLIGLKNPSLFEQTKQLIKINDPIKTFTAEFQKDHQILDSQFVHLVTELKKMIGNPHPILDPGAGFSQAFISYGSNLITSKTAQFSLDTGIYNFNKASDLMFYNMICGSDEALIEETMITGFKFITPRITTVKPQLVSLCAKQNGTVSTKNLYQLKIKFDQKNLSANDFLISYLDQNILGNITSGDRSSEFENWWIRSILPNIQKKFKNLDSRYQTLVTEAYDNVLDQKNFLEFSIDFYSHHSDHLSTNILDTFNFELEFYIQSLDYILNKKTVTTDKYTDFIIFASKKDISYTDQQIKDFEKSNPQFFKLINLKKSFKKLISLVNNRSPVQFKQMAELNTEIKNTSDEVFEKFNEIEKLAKQNSTDLSAEVKAIFAIKKGFDSLEIELKRYAYLKVNLAQRLEIETTELNDLMKKAQSKNQRTNNSLNGK